MTPWVLFTRRRRARIGLEAGQFLDRRFWTTTGLGALAGVLCGPVLVAVAIATLDITILAPGAPSGAVFLLHAGTFVAFAVAELGGSMPASYVSVLPYFVLLIRELTCFGRGFCGPPPAVSEALPLALLPTVIAGWFGNLPSVIASRRASDASREVRVLYFLVGSILVWLLVPLLSGVGIPYEILSGA